MTADLMDKVTMRTSVKPGESQMVWKVQSAQELPTLLFSFVEKTKFNYHIGNYYSLSSVTRGLLIGKGNIQYHVHLHSQWPWALAKIPHYKVILTEIPLLGGVSGRADLSFDWGGAEEGGPIWTLWSSFLGRQHLEVQCCVHCWHRSRWRSGWAWLSLMPGGNAGSCFWRHCILRGHLLW